MVPTHSRDFVGNLRLEDQERRSAVTENPVQFFTAQSRAHGHEDRADLARREEHVDPLGTIPGKERYALALADAERAKHVCRTSGSAVQIGEGIGPAAEDEACSIAGPTGLPLE